MSSLPPEGKAIHPAARQRPSAPPARPVRPESPACHVGASGPPAQVAASRLRLRRTAIPVLLTLAVMLPVLGSAGVFALPADSPLALSPPMAAALSGTGVACGAVAAMNMLAVRQALRAGDTNRCNRRSVHVDITPGA